MADGTQYLTAYGGPAARYRCQSCGAPFEIVRHGVGTMTCPYCRRELAFDVKGVLVLVGPGTETEGLDPIERRMATRFGLGAEEVKAARRPK